MEGDTVAAGFRHKSWFLQKARDVTLATERERGPVNVVIDEPNTTANSIPAVWEVTNQKPLPNLVRKVHLRARCRRTIRAALAAASGGPRSHALKTLLIRC